MSSRTELHPSKHEAGQAIIIIALGFVVLLAFTGLVVDVARVFVQRGELRRAVDAAGLAATGQFRTGATGAQITQAAINLIRSHGISDPSVIVETCNLAGTTFNSALCPPPDQPARKLVHVSAKADVSMLFLQLVGIPTVGVAADSTAEAAAVDAVLVLDTSESQAYDAPSAYAYNGNATKGCGPADVGQDNINACIKACNDSLTHPCYPLEKVKEAAKAFVDKMYSGYDRIAVVTYARNSDSPMPLGISLDDARQAITDMRANDSFPGETPGTPCSYLSIPGERWICGSSNPGGALLRASQEFSRPPLRPDALWVVIFLSSGGLNATDRPLSPIGDPLTDQFGFCPPKDPLDLLTRDNPPPCRDQQWSVHHPAPMITMTSPLYDAEDYAFDWATYLGEKPGEHGGGGLGVLVYTIALGQKAVCTTGATYSPGPPVVCGNWNPAYVDLGSNLPNTGELFLRYLAAVGDDGNAATDPCAGFQSGVQCGNYYFAPSGNELLGIFLQIAGRIFTRLSG
jgi:hypothetical protein